MKKVLSISLILAVLLASMSKTAIYLTFKINQSYIEQTLCINRNAPEKKCHGKCFLNDRLAKNDSENNTPNPSSQFEETLKINFFPTQFDPEKQWMLETASFDNFSPDQLLSQPYYSSLLRPPQLV